MPRPDYAREDLPSILEKVSRALLVVTDFREEYLAPFEETEEFSKIFGKPGEEGQNYGTSAYLRNYTFLGLVLKEEGEWSLVEQRNKMVKGETIEVLLPSGESFEQTLDGLLDEERTPIDSAPHAQQKVYISFPHPVPRGALLRKRKEQ